MALVLDTGPVISALDRSERDHGSCRSLIKQTNEVLIIPAPVLVEICYWIETRMRGGALGVFLRDIAYQIEDLRAEDYERARQICDRYTDTPVGFVDAAVLAVVERLNEPKLATLDRRRFSLMRPRHVAALRLLPSE